jgi:prepilin-type processing-associated H-X9-DG protein
LAGAHALFVDGHVRFVQNSIDLDIWLALASRAGGEPVGNAEY